MKQEEYIWGEIRWDYLDDHFTIDAWLTDDDMEEGKVIAKVDKEGNVQYLDERAKTNPYAQEIIAEVKQQCLLDRVVKRIELDLEQGDVSAIEELLSYCPKENLIGYLPEEEWDNFN
jgi:hypothetical protein